MKKYILLVLISFCFFISNSQNEKVDLKQSYILTKKGEKIPIVPNEGIKNKRNNISYCASKVFKNTRFLKKDKEKNIPIKTYKFKHKDLSINKIVKIVDQNKLYLPVITKKNEIIYRVVLKNKNYTLGYYHLAYWVGSGKTMSFVDRERFIIIDNNTNEVQIKGDIDTDEGVISIKNYFGKCINQKELVVLEYYEPYKTFLKGEKSTDEKVLEWYEFIKGSFINIGYLSPSYSTFLPNYNQYICE